MTISAVTERGSGFDKTTDTTHAISPSAAITVGKIAWCYCITDNTTLVTGASTDHTSVTDTDGHTWTKVFERNQSSAGGVNDGTTHSLWFTKVTSEIGTGDSVTLTIGTARPVKLLLLFENTVTAGSTVQLAASGAAFEEANSATVSVTLAGLPSKEYLFLGCVAREEIDITWTEDADYTNVFASEGVASSGGGSATNQTGFLGHRIATLTGDTFAPTLAGVGSRAAALVAIEEVASAQTLTGALFASTATFSVGVLSQSAPPAPSAPSTGGNRMGGTGAIRKPPRSR